MKTLIIDNFKGDLTPRINGDINNGMSYWLDPFGHDPFSKPGNLTWQEAPIQIDPTASVLTDLIMAGKVRMEGNILYVYAIGHTGRLYKIQVNDPATYNPDYDNPVLLTTLTIGSPTFTRGGFIDFFGATEKIYIGHDVGVTSVNFNGTGEAAIAGTWTQNVPRPLQQFLGKEYIGNGTNIAEIDSTGTVTTSTKLSPGFPSGTQVRDIRITRDGNYIQCVVTRSAISDMTVTTPNTTLLSPTDSYVFKWNGTDTGYTAFTSYPSAILNGMITFSDSEYVFGYDISGEAIFSPIRKLINELPNSLCGYIYPNALTSMGNMVQWGGTLPFGGNTYSIILQYGNISDHDGIQGFWAPVFAAATGTETDVVRMPCQMLISNIAEGTSTSGYADNIVGTSKVYYSTLESSSGTTGYKLYKWFPFPTGLHDSVFGLYQTQNQLFSKKITVSEVRIYAQPWVANNSFIIDLIGSDDNPIAGGSYTFTASANSTGIATAGQIIIGEDYAWYSPDTEPVYSIGLRITNNGIANHVINKVEIDYSEAGK